MCCRLLLVRAEDFCMGVCASKHSVVANVGLCVKHVRYVCVVEFCMCVRFEAFCGLAAQWLFDAAVGVFL